MAFLSILIVCRILMSNTSLVRIFWQLLCQSLYQNTREYKSLDRLMRYSKTITKQCLVIVVAIWVLMAMIISKSFSSGLLSTYFGRQSKPLFETIDDIINSEGLRVIMQNRDKNKFKDLMPNQFNTILSKNKIDWFNSFKINDLDHSLKIAKSVKEGSKVLLCSSFITEMFKDYFMNFPLTIGSRHSMSFLVFSVSRRHPFGKKISDL